MFRFGFAFLAIASASMLVLEACGAFGSDSPSEEADASSSDSGASEASPALDGNTSGQNDAGVDAFDPSIVFSDDFKAGCGKFTVKNGTISHVSEGAQTPGACRVCRADGGGSAYPDFYTAQSVVTDAAAGAEYTVEGWIRFDHGNLVEYGVGFFVGGTWQKGGAAPKQTTFVKTQLVYTTAAGDRLNPGAWGNAAGSGETCFDVDDIVVRKK